MTKPNWSNIAEDTTLTAAVDAVVTAIPVASGTGWPAVPFYAVLTPGFVATEEIILVTNVVGLTWTVTRQADGTTAKAHASGATVRHSVVAFALDGYALGGREVLPTAPNVGDAPVWNGAAYAPAAAGGGSVDWPAITNTPTTISGYGITDGVLTSDARLSDARTPTSHVLATNTALGAEQTISGAAAGQVLRASSATAANFQALALADVPDAASATTLATLTTSLATHAALTTVHGLSNAGFTLTIPATGTAALLATANVFTAGQNILVSAGTTALTGTALATGAGVQGTSASGTGGAFSAATGTPVSAALTNAPPTAVSTALLLASAGTGIGTGHGLQITTNLKSSTTASQPASTIATRWTDATHATRTTAVAIATVLSAGALTNRIEIDAGAGADTTGLLLWDVNSGTLKRVTVGAADSAGAGFRQLRIAN